MALAFGVSTVAATGFTASPFSSSAITTQATGSGFLLYASGPLATVYSAPTDNKGNTYPATPTLSFLLNGSTNSGTVWFISNANGGAGHIFTLNFTGTGSIVFIPLEITGTTSAYALLDQSATTPNISGTTANSPSITPTVNGAPVVSIFAGNNGAANTTITDTTGYNNIIQVNAQGATNSNVIAAIGGFIQTIAGATNDIFVTGSAAFIGTATLSFNPFSIPPPVVVPPQGPMPRQIYVMP